MVRGPKPSQITINGVDGVPDGLVLDDTQFIQDLDTGDFYVPQPNGTNFFIPKANVKAITMSPAQAALAVGTDALTLGFGSELAAPTRAILEQIANFSRTPEERVGLIDSLQDAYAENEAMLERAREEYPTTSLLADIGGNVAPVLATAGVSAIPSVSRAVSQTIGRAVPQSLTNVLNPQLYAPGQSVASTVGKAALAGAGYGAIAGAGQDGSIEDRATRAAFSAPIGAALGAATIPVVSAITGGVQRAGRGVRNLFRGNRQSPIVGYNPNASIADDGNIVLGGAPTSDNIIEEATARPLRTVSEGNVRNPYDPVTFPSLREITRDTLGNPIERGTRKDYENAARNITRAIYQDNPNIQKLIQDQNVRRLLNQYGDEVFLADLPLKRLQDTLGVAARGEGSGPQIVSTALTDRQYRQQERILNALTKATGTTPGNTQRVIDEIIARRAAEAGPLYEQAAKQQQFISTTPVREYIENELKIAGPARARVLQSELGNLYDDSGRLIADPRKLEEVAQEINARLFSNQRLGVPEAFGKTPQTQNEIKRQLQSAIDENNPLFKDARRIYAGESAFKDAAELGRDALKLDRTNVTNAYNQMTEGEQEIFRNAVRQSVEDLYSGARGGKGVRPTADAAEALLAASGRGQRLTPAFKDDKSFADFMRLLEGETEKRNLLQRTIGGSSTAERLASDRVPQNGPGLKEGIDLIVEVAQGQPLNIFQRGLQSVTRAFDPAAAIKAETARALTTPNRAEQDIILNDIARLLELEQRVGAGKGVASRAANRTGSSGVQGAINFIFDEDRSIR